MENLRTFPYSFGELLKTFRKHQRLTQKQLAQELGVSMNTVSLWELGTHLPSSRGMVLELARHLLLNEQETRQLLEASLTALSPHWQVPFPRNPLFTGREKILKTLHTQLSVDPGTVLTQASALYGLGGVGKTQIALEYAYRHALEYGAVFWIGAETVEQIISSLLRIADVLQLPGRHDQNQERIVAAVQHWLSTHSQWLLIWDNVEDIALLDRFLPSYRQGALLITTRRQALGTSARGLNLCPMEREEGILFLLRRAKLLEPDATGEQMRQIAGQTPSQYTTAVELVTVMGGLPLALDQAGAYIDEAGCSLAGYLRLYEQQRYQLLDRRGVLNENHPHSVVATLWLGCQQVAQRHPVALDLLHFCAFVSPEAIPEELLQEGLSHLECVSEPMTADPYQFDQALITLRSLSLVQRHPETQTLSIHRLVQIVLREEMSVQEQAGWVKRVIISLNAMFPEVTHDTWRLCERLLPHVLAIATTAPPDDVGNQEVAELLRKAADYLRERAQYEQAKQWYQRAIDIRARALGAEHPDVAHLLNSLALLHHKQGNHEQAEQLYQQALHIQEQALGQEHLAVTHSLSNLANLYTLQGKHELAEPLYRRVIGIREQILGPEHPDIRQPLTGLAILYKNQGKYAQAEPLYERAISIMVQACGPEHPQIVRLLYNLGRLYQEQGKYAQAEPLFLRSLSIEEQAWGPEHPDVGHPLIGLAILYLEQGKDEQAEPLLLRALSLWEGALGPEHLLVAYPLHNLALLLQRQEKYEQAEALSQRALHITEQALGAHHLQLAHPLTGLADLYAAQRKYEQAEALYRRALHITEQALGQEHPDLALALNGLANIFRERGKDADAESLYQRVLVIRKQHLGQHHPDTAQTLHDLSILRQKQGNPDEAISLADHALKIRVQSLGGAHPKTVATRTLYTQLVQAQKCTREGKVSEERTKEQLNHFNTECHRANVSLSLNEVVDPLQEFLSVCCELHPLACCRVSDLWQAYEQWITERQGRYSLPRRAFAAQLKAHGCRADRTSSARIWRGITLVNSQTMTRNDRK